MTWTLRAAERADARAVAGLVRAAYSRYVERIGGTPGPMREDYAEVISSRGVTVAERDGTMAGVIVLAITDGRLVIENVAVLPAYQGRGLGRRLLEGAERDARRGGFDSIYLYTHEKMTENRRLYSRLGYVECEPRSRRQAALVYMRKQLARPGEAEGTRHG